MPLSADHLPTDDEFVTLRPSGFGTGHAERFVRDLLHDLRAPLRGVLGFVDALREDCGDGLDDRGHGHLRRISRGAERMDEILADVRDLAKLSVTHPVSETFSVAETLDGVCLRWKQAVGPEVADRVEITTNVPEGLTLTTDRRLVARAVAALLDNAATYSVGGAGGRVALSARADETATVLAVRDEGLGVGPVDHARIFEPFVRLHGEEVYRGSGVGLAVVARVCEMLGCRVAVRSAIGRGSMFFLTFPASTSQAGSNTSSPEDAP